MPSDLSPRAEDASPVKGASGPLTDLVLTLPIFIAYHLGVIFLPVRNAADVVTRELVALADHSMAAYGGLTLGIGFVFVMVLGLAGRGHAMRWQRFAVIALEGVVYAVAMRLVASYVVGRMVLGPTDMSSFAGLVMSFGAGFYEEIAFRALLFGFGAKLVLIVFPIARVFPRQLFYIGWALFCAAVFSGWHYVGALGDPFELPSFVFRLVCGLVFTAIYVFRGFAPAVWTHAIYDVWVLVF